MRYLLPELLFHGGQLHRGWALGVDDSGKVASIGLAPAEATASGTRLAQQALLPGLANAHSHAFQRLIRGRTEYIDNARADDDFWSWRERMYEAATTLTPEDVFTASRQAFLEMALSGITTVGEFHYLHHQPDGTPYDERNELAHQVVRAAREVGVRITLLRVGYARAGHRVDANPRQRRFIDPDVDTFLQSVESLRNRFAGSDVVRVGLAPHSVRAVPRSWLYAVERALPELPLHMHVAEQTAEIDACVGETGLRPVEYLLDIGLIGPRFTAVHAVHLEPREALAMGRAKATVCACPSTERNLGDGVVPADALLQTGVRLCLGSDSQATIDLFDEARQLEGHLRLGHQRRAVLDPKQGRVDGLAARLFDFATREGARSLGFEGHHSLDVGTFADFLTVSMEHPSLVGTDEQSLLPALILGGGTSAVTNVAVGGKWIVENGRHPLMAASATDFSALSRRVFSRA